jgi:rubrerythrin
MDNTNEINYLISQADANRTYAAILSPSKAKKLLSVARKMEKEAIRLSDEQHGKPSDEVNGMSDTELLHELGL